MIWICFRSHNTAGLGHKWGSQAQILYTTGEQEWREEERVEEDVRDEILRDIKQEDERLRNKTEGKCRFRIHNSLCAVLNLLKRSI